MPDDLKKGELNKDWGYRIETPFYIVSSSDSGRYLDLLSNQMVIKTPNGRTSQQWFFNQQTKTIRSWRTRSYSWTVKKNNMVVGGTNSEWYQLFKYDTEKLNFYNVKDLKVLDVEGHRDEEGNKVVTAKSEKKQAF